MERTERCVPFTEIHNKILDVPHSYMSVCKTGSENSQPDI